MNILQVSSNDLVGKRFNGQYLTQNLPKYGHQANHLVWNKEGRDFNTYQMNRLPAGDLLQKVFESLEDRLSIRAILQPNSFKLKFEDTFKKADIVHYHIMYWPNFFSLLSLPKLTHLKPSVWTIHDFWPMTGHCVYPFDCDRWKTGCGECPYLETNFSMRRDNTHLMWKFKEKIYRKSRFEIVAASKYMYNKINQSPLLSQFPIHYVPFGLDLNIFKPKNSNLSKRFFGIQPDEVVVTFRSAPGPFKGLDFIKNALAQLQLPEHVKVCLLTFNIKGEFYNFTDRFRVIDLGWVNDDEILMSAYDASDIFLMPSVQETFGMMAMEAMAFGKPVVIFSGTSLEEIVGGEEHGLVVPQGDILKLRSLIEKLISDVEFRKDRGEKALKFAQANYSLDLHVKRLLSIYDSASSSQLAT